MKDDELLPDLELSDFGLAAIRPAEPGQLEADEREADQFEKLAQLEQLERLAQLRQREQLAAEVVLLRVLVVLGFILWLLVLIAGS